MRRLIPFASAVSVSANRDAMDGDFASLEGRIALVTGAGRGIGRAVSLELARRGAELVLVGRTAGSLEAVRKEIEGAGARASVLAADIRDSRWLEKLGPPGPAIDVLVNNA